MEQEKEQEREEEKEQEREGENEQEREEEKEQEREEEKEQEREEEKEQEREEEKEQEREGENQKDVCINIELHAYSAFTCIYTYVLIGKDPEYVRYFVYLYIEYSHSVYLCIYNHTFMYIYSYIYNVYAYIFTCIIRHILVGRDANSHIFGNGCCITKVKLSLPLSLTFWGSLLSFSLRISPLFLTPDLSSLSHSGSLLSFSRSLCYEVPTFSRLPKNIGLFCKRALQKRDYILQRQAEFYCRIYECW